MNPFKSSLRPILRSTYPLTRSRPFHSSRPILSSPLTNIFDTSNTNDTLSSRPRLSVASLSAESGFVLSDGLQIPGGCIFLENRVFLWDVDGVEVDELSGRGNWEKWGKERLEIFERVVPRPEILLLGTGPTVVPPPAWLRKYISSLGISLDVMDTRNACSTFNLLSEEGRTVGAALMPLRGIDPRNYLARRGG